MNRLASLSLSAHEAPSLSVAAQAATNGIQSFSSQRIAPQSDEVVPTPIITESFDPGSILTQSAASDRKISYPQPTERRRDA
ncbi:unnamed protein product [Ectocarpus sp. CCAP 1310/34]|nr:unnamed protein product [Ectocarpus sp. CCAP 1310/34]